MRYSKELLDSIAKECTSYQQVMRKLGLKISGGSSSHLKSRFEKYGIDISHFTGQASNCGQTHKGGSEKLDWSVILVNNRLKDRRDHTWKIKRAMIEYGFEEKCFGINCNLRTEWNGKVLTLQIDHINGDGCDNRPENLRFLCPNCHSQTDTFCSKNIKTKQ
jgi:hypothetical protein